MKSTKRYWNRNPKGRKSYNGLKYGKLTVLYDLEDVILPSGQINRFVMCKCDCGNEKPIRLLHLANNKIISCGCLQRIRGGKSHDPLFKRWKAMVERCTVPGNIRAKRYMNRGINVCDEWLVYENFEKWAFLNGYDEKLQIDRIDNNGNYEPANCRFVPHTLNCVNKEVTFRVDYRGVRFPLVLLLDILSISRSHYPAIRARILRGWDHTRAVETKIREGNYVKG